MHLREALAKSGFGVGYLRMGPLEGCVVSDMETGS